MGEQDPMQAILTRSAGDGSWDRAAFFESGRLEIAALMAEALQHQPDLRRTRALDFGCGLGRLTAALGTWFESAHGLDIAESMVAAARAEHAAMPHVTFAINAHPDLRSQPDGHFDFVLAWIVLQHMPPTLMEKYIAEFIRVLAPGGLLAFQIPAVMEDPLALYCDAPIVGTGIKRYVPARMIRLSRWVRFQAYRRFVPHMEMYALPPERVAAVVNRSGGRVLAQRPDQSHGPATPGFAYWVTR